MKKFKGGLYADLSNYNTTLPNTEILLNFFKSNPIGYRSGGMVRGIAGGNPTGMRVTGGFLADAQNFRMGSKQRVKKKKDTVSAYYREPEEYGLLYEQPSTGYKIADTLGAYQDPKFEYENQRWVSGKSGMPISDPSLYESKGLTGIDVYGQDKGAGERVKKARDQKVNFLQGQGKSPPTNQSTGEPYGSWEEVPNFMINAMHKEAIAGLPKDIEGEGITALEGGSREDYRQLDLSDPEVKKYQAKIAKEKKDQEGFLDPKKIITSKSNGSTNGTTFEKPKLTKPKRKDGDSVFSGGSTYDKMEAEGLLETPRDAKTITDELFTNNEEYQKVIDGYKDASESDKAALKKIGEEYYGKDKGKDAPAWAMPLMMMGLQWAASDNPDMLGAIAEGGIKGVEEYARAQKEKREDAKDKIELDLKKITKSIDISSRDLNFAKDMATIKSSTLNQAMQISSNEMINYNNNLRAAITADADRELKEWEIKEQSMINWANLDAKYDLADADIQLKMMDLRDKKEARGDELAYKREVLEVEILKTNNDWQKHLNLVNLEKVSTGKTTTIMMPDADGNKVATKVHVYLNKESGQFETKVLGFAPPDQDFVDNLTETIRQQITDSKTITIDGKDYDISGMMEKGDMLAIEDLVTRKVELELNKKFTTKEEIQNIISGGSN
jgi:hypothetical protein